MNELENIFNFLCAHASTNEDHSKRSKISADIDCRARFVVHL